MKNRAIPSRSLLSISFFNSAAIGILVSLLFISGQTIAQDKAQLQKERDQISKDIDLTNKLLKETRASRSKQQAELSLINKKINLRED